MGLQASRAVVDGREVVVFAFRPERARAGGSALVARLSASEREVVALLLEGRSNAEIARARGTTLGTIGKQIESAYRRLGVRSRGELAVLLG